MATRSNAGGGHGSRQVVKKPQRLGSARERVHPPGVSQLGEHVGSHTTTGSGSRSDTNYRGQPLFKGQGGPQSKLGNEIAATTVCGVGGSRTIHKTGSQQSGPVREMPKGREILGDFGPESRAVAMDTNKR